MRREGKRDEGSIVVELAVLMPALFVLALVVLVFGRTTETRQLVTEASRAGAQAAAVLPTASSAEAGAADMAVVSIFGRDHTCAGAQVTTDTSHFYAGGSVSVTVTCVVSLSDLSVPGVPGSETIRATATAPIDPYRAIG